MILLILDNKTKPQKHQETSSNKKLFKHECCTKISIFTNQSQTKKKSKNGIMSLRKENTKLHYIQKST